MQIDRIAKDTLREWPVNGFSQIMTIIALESFACCIHIVSARFFNKTDLIKRRCHGKIVDETEIEPNVFLNRTLFDHSYIFLTHIRTTSAIIDALSTKNKMCMTAGNNGRGFLPTGTYDNLGIKFIAVSCLLSNADTVFSYIFFPFFQCFGCHVL